jgi:acyl-coenzyme A thioesterase PaaI-like protein
VTTTDDKGGAPYGRLLDSVRRLQVGIAVANGMPAEVLDSLTADLDAAVEQLEKYAGPENEQWSGQRRDLPAKGNVLLPPYTVDFESESESYGRVTFTRYYLGGGSAAHGGTQPLLFDDLLGGLVTRARAGAGVRTAYLKVDYRKITPLDVELRFEVKVDRIEGRKTFATGKLLDDEGNVLCDAEGLFLVLLPGQP